MPKLSNNQIRAQTGTLAAEVASAGTDPVFYGGLDILPNPDDVLRKLGKTHSTTVFDAIEADAHVISEMRAIRAGLLSFEWQLKAGDDDKQALAAWKFCSTWMSQCGVEWASVFWTMARCIFRGMAPHELVWEVVAGDVVPTKIIDRPEHRFRYDNERRLRLLTKSNSTKGELLPPAKFVTPRHMASWGNPYGRALLSSCFWPYTFKHNGVKWFAKFCQKYGFPWPVAKYPQGTANKDVDALINALVKALEDGVMAIPDGNVIDFLNAGGTGKLVHQGLIEYCNREISKALTSQTLASDQQDTGARAAAQTHRERELSVNQSDRHLVEQSVNQILRWMTLFNFGDSVSPPTFSFYQEEHPPTQWLAAIDRARQFLPISPQWAASKLRIPLAEGATISPIPSQFSAPMITDQDTTATNTAIAERIAETVNPASLTTNNPTFAGQN